MNVLAICSALNKSYIAFFYESNTYSKIIENDENYHSLYIVSSIKNMAQHNKIPLNKINAIAVNAGPGSFSGIRVAMTIAKVMAGELNIPLIPLNTAEILLEAYNCDYLVMDARRDMYYLGDKNAIALIQKDKIQDLIKDKTVLCDNRSHDLTSNCTTYEDKNADLGAIMVDLAIKKYNKTDDKEEFNPIRIEANYIQTPPIFS